MTTPAGDDLPALPSPADSVGTRGQDTAQLLQREIEGLRYRRLGMTYDQIARQMGYSDRSAARDMIVRALNRRHVENVTELRILENDRLDADEQVLRTIIHDPAAGAAARIRAIDARTRLSARRSALNGLDAPKAFVVSSGAMATVEDALSTLRETVFGEVTHRDDDTADPTSGE